jgi:flagellin
MSISIQTNVASIKAQENLRVNSDFQSQTINRLTSGYRINNSSDDAAGLAVANKFRGDITELTQGVRNANDGISTLQIVDGGLNNISTMLDRLRTLATQSASAGFTGNRQTLNTEYQTLLGEISRQASNIGMSTGSIGGRFNTSMDVYVGGGSSAANAKVTVDLSGSRVDSTGLGIANTNVLGGNASVLDATVNLNTGSFLAGGSQQFTVNYGAGLKTTVTLNGGVAGVSGSDAVAQINTQLGGTGISAVINSAGNLAFYGENTAFNITSGAASAGTALQTAAKNVSNANTFDVVGGAYTAAATTASFLVGGQSVSVSLSNSTIGQNITELNNQLNSYGIQAIYDTTNAKIELQGNQAFSWSGGSTVIGATGASVAPATTASNTTNALAAISALQTAVSTLGAVQGKVGTGENDLSYAISLAQSQITSFSAAQSRIRDTDVAAEAANLTKAQVLQQTSIAAMAQANSAPQAIMALLRG